jgi:hypothetical protein
MVAKNQMGVSQAIQLFSRECARNFGYARKVPIFFVNPASCITVKITKRVLNPNMI